VNLGETPPGSKRSSKTAVDLVRDGGECKSREACKTMF
jgi:hypothetical protein